MTIPGNLPSDASSDAPAESTEQSTRPKSADATESTTRPRGEADALEQDMLLEDEYDGILEYDNPRPAWWKNIFWGSFVFSLGYLFWFHLGGNGGSVQDEYESEVGVARALAAKD